MCTAVQEESIEYVAGTIHALIQPGTQQPGAATAEGDVEAEEAEEEAGEGMEEESTEGQARQESSGGAVCRAEASEEEAGEAEEHGGQPAQQQQKGQQQAEERPGAPSRLFLISTYGE